MMHRVEGGCEVYVEGVDVFASDLCILNGVE